jgi:hypothetical protein
MTIKKSDFLPNFLMFCLGATVGRRISDSYIMRHLAAKSADSMLMNLPHCILMDVCVTQELSVYILLDDPAQNSTLHVPYYEFS